MSAAAGGDWLRKILMDLRFAQTEVQNIGTHSCKATCLSWMAKAGVDLSCRRLLGYHVDPTTKTCLVYSRDAVSGPLRELDRVLKMIRALKFSPDSTRSGYFLNAATGSAPVEQEPQHDNEDGDDASDSEDSEDEEPSEEQHAATEKAIDEVVGEWSEHSTLEGLGLVMMQLCFKTGIPGITIFVPMRVRCISGVEEIFLTATSRWNEDLVSSLLSVAPDSNLSDLPKTICDA